MKKVPLLFAAFTAFSLCSASAVVIAMDEITDASNWTLTGNGAFNATEGGTLRSTPNGAGVSTWAPVVSPVAGGVMLNATLNGRWRDGNPFRQEFVLQASGTDLIIIGGNGDGDAILASGTAVSGGAYVPNAVAGFDSAGVVNSGHSFARLRVTIDAAGVGSIFVTATNAEGTMDIGTEALLNTFTSTADLSTIDGIEFRSERGADRLNNFVVDIAPIPEPSTSVLALIAGFGMIVRRRR